MTDRIAIVLGGAIALGVFASPARAQQAPVAGEKVTKRVCIAAAERGQELRDGNQHRDARGQFSLCARPECPTRLTVECKRWLSEAEAAIASVRIEPVDGDDAPVTSVRVFVDGKPWTDDAAKEPLLLDPGSHEIRLERAGSPPVTRAVTLAMGERGRVLRIPLAIERETPPAPTAKLTSSPPERDEESGGSIVAPIALGALGVVALGAAGTFWLLGNGELEEARARCTAGCSSSEADGARTKHLIGDVSLGVGVVSLAVATVLLVTRTPRRTAPAATAAGANAWVAPTASGAIASFRGRF